MGPEEERQPDPSRATVTVGGKKPGKREGGVHVGFQEIEA